MSVNRTCEFRAHSRFGCRSLPGICDSIACWTALFGLAISSWMSAPTSDTTRSTPPRVSVVPAADNVAVLRENIAANALHNVVVHQTAAGRTNEVRDLFLRGDMSAVNSLFPESVYASVTDVVQVKVMPLDDLVDGRADVVKID